MNTITESIDLDMEESNELLFKINVEGKVDSPAVVRLVCESDNISYMFDGQPTDVAGVIQFIVPKMHKRLNENSTCVSKVEVLIDDRYFVPVEFNINFKKTVKVFAESVSHNKLAVKKQQNIEVSAVPIVVKKKKQNNVTSPVVGRRTIINDRINAKIAKNLREHMENRKKSKFSSKETLNNDVLRSLK